MNRSSQRRILGSQQVSSDYGALWAGTGKASAALAAPGSERGNPPAAAVIQDALGSPFAFLPKK